MNLKKFALKGIIILAVFVALCMFFSGTIKTISTAKVRFVSAKSGKLEEKIELNGTVVFPDVEKISIDVPEGQSITITSVNTRVGYTVAEGDVLMQAEVTNFETAMQTCETAYNTAMEQMMLLENQSKDIRIRRTDEAYAEAYYALRDAKQAAMKAELAMSALLNRGGMTLPESGYPDGADEELTEAIDAYRAADAARQEAQAAFDRAARYGVDEAAWNYITQRQNYQDQMDENQETMRLLTALKTQVAEIKAPWDGYTAEINLKAGDICDGSQWLIAVTAQDASPVLRVDLSDVERNIVKGTTVQMSTNRYGTVETKVLESGTDSEGKKYCHVEITNGMLQALGSIYSMSQADVPMSIVYKDRENTSLLPSSAVHGTGNDRYVFIVERTDSGLGGSSMKVRKYSVTVLNEVDGTASIQEEISYYTLAYMEDRQIQDGDSVMEYTE